MKPFPRNNLIPRDLQHPLLLSTSQYQSPSFASKGIPELYTLRHCCPWLAMINLIVFFYLALTIGIDMGSPLEYVGYGETKG